MESFPRGESVEGNLAVFQAMSSKNVFEGLGNIVDCDDLTQELDHIALSCSSVEE